MFSAAWMIVMRRAVGLLKVVLLISAVMLGEARAQLLTAPVMVDQFQDMPVSRPEPAPVSPPAPSPSSGVERVLSANPLWSIPLANLKASRERPLFSPSRRPAPVAAAVQPPPAPPALPPKPPEAEKSQLTLIGTAVGENGERIGLFANSANKSTLTLKVGKDHQGWILRELAPLRATLGKGLQSVVLDLPRPDMKPDARKDVAGVVGPGVTVPQPVGASAQRPAAAPINIVQPQPSAPQVNPFQKFWAR